jgi:hypothetical protein
MIFGFNGIHLIKDVAKDCGVNTWVIKNLARKLDICQKFGRQNVIRAEDLPALRIGLKALGYKVTPPEPPVAEPAVAEEVIAGH